MDRWTARQLLGVRADASGDEVRDAFRRFARSAHPDRAGDPERFRRGVEAYRVLQRAPSAPRNVTFVRRQSLPERVRVRVVDVWVRLRPRVEEAAPGGPGAHRQDGDGRS